MSDVTLQIGGRSYTVACADGQEPHVIHLASMIDVRLARMGNNISPNDAKNLLFAGLMLADELDEAKKSLKAVPDSDDSVDERLAGQLERIASALENAASTLEGGNSNA